MRRDGGGRSESKAVGSAAGRVACTWYSENYRLPRRLNCAHPYARTLNDPSDPECCSSRFNRKDYLTRRMQEPPMI